eukprot:g870.t1
MADAKVTPAAEKKELELMKDEVGGLMYEYGISTITFYEGDAAAAGKALREQLSVVVKANPWLAGRLTKTKSGTRLEYPDVPDESIDIDPLFSVITANEADETLKPSSSNPYVATCTSLYKSKKLLVGNGFSLVGKDEPLMRLTITESEAGNFGLIFSMSHVIGDGRTYYDIYQMLQPGSGLVRPLKVERNMNFKENMLDAFGRKPLKWIEGPAAMLLYMLGMMCSSKVKCFAFHLDEEKVTDAKTKAAAEGGVPYVTTNDVLTSGFFNACDTRIGMMGLDCRDKGLEGIEKDMAGNYVTALVLDSEVFGTPASLRQMYTPGKPYETTKRALPGCCCCCSNNTKFAMVTNWSTFPKSLISFDDCKLVLHLPVQNPAYSKYDLMTPFASGIGEDGKLKRGVICWTVSSDEGGLRSALPVGDNISDDLFPRA